MIHPTGIKDEFLGPKEINEQHDSQKRHTLWNILQGTDVEYLHPITEVERKPEPFDTVCQNKSTEYYDHDAYEHDNSESKAKVGPKKNVSLIES